VKQSFFADLIRVARRLPEDSRIPCYFEKRLMKFVREARRVDIWSLWLPTMRRSAMGGLAVLLITAAYIKFTENRTPDLLAGDLERTVLASVNLDETW
jgi:hypothetical protein